VRCWVIFHATAFGINFAIVAKARFVIIYYVAAIPCLAIVTPLISIVASFIGEDIITRTVIAWFAAAIAGSEAASG
jgi:hypothetical protein